MVLRPISTSQSIKRAPDHVWGIPVHLFIPPDRLNSSSLEYSSSGCLDHPNYGFFWKIDIKSDGGEYKWSFLRVIFNFGISLAVTHEDLFITSLWVKISIFKVDPILYPLTGDCIKTWSRFRSKSDIFRVEPVRIPGFEYMPVNR